MTAALFEIFEALAAPPADQSGTPMFAVRPVASYQSYFVGKDSQCKACLLVRTSDASGRAPPPIRLESLDAQFELGCRITDARGDTQDGRFTVARCRSAEPETIRYFLSVCHIIMRHMGDTPSRTALASAVQRLASIFQSIRRPPVRSLNGLFGELFLISKCRSPARALAAWRIDDSARFDFSTGDIRLEVKTCAGRLRQHTFSFDQCNPPPGTVAVLASLMIERVPRGLALSDLIAMIQDRIGDDENLLLKLHDVVASTLGTSLAISLDLPFDQRLAESSLRYFDLRTIPAMREQLPANVSDVRFASDLSGSEPLDATGLVDRDPLFWDLLPADIA
ncbi:PD-(D/E)XK motif protein [Thioclava sp. JE_KL1]|uniref:PD-(D/E)XK motif protein n=1 Tax=Thioclava sp. JE_KL1 TaxID=2651187 RepID=UPI00128D2C62|nr:PD-(D/E)XK motif protein [Thioclava sp. JE_KL1]MPQ92378.1 PD-(D/E)XK motif protein [Thioclava sp. JE_KL1]